MRTEKSIWPGFAPRLRHRTEVFLERQARKGWMFQGFGGFGWKFRRCEPKSLHFSVVYFPEPKEDDIPARNRLEEFREFCAHDGWYFAASSEKMQIFYSEKENPIPIETDAELEVENIYNILRLDIRGMLLLAFVYFLAGVHVILGTNRGSVVSLLTSQKSLWTVFLSVFLLSFFAIDTLRLRLWYVKAKRHAREQGEFLDENRFWIIVEMIAHCAPLIVFVGLVAIAGWKVAVWRIGTSCMIIACLAVVLGLVAERTPDKKKRFRRCVILGFLVWSFGLDCAEALSERWNVDFDLHPPEGSAWVQYQEVPPLDAGECTIDLRETGFLARYRVEGTEATYTVLEVKTGFLYDLCLDEMLHEHFFPADAAPWGAQRAYQLGVSESPSNPWWILCYEDRIVEISLPEMPTPGQMALIGETLG